MRPKGELHAERVATTLAMGELRAALERIAKRGCEYAESTGCHSLPVVRTVCNPCIAQTALNNEFKE